MSRGASFVPVTSDCAPQKDFDSKDWYDGYLDPDEFDETVLNDYEIYNRNLIVEYEKMMGF